MLHEATSRIQYLVFSLSVVHWLCITENMRSMLALCDGIAKKNSAILRSSLKQSLFLQLLKHFIIIIIIIIIDIIIIIKKRLKKKQQKV